MHRTCAQCQTAFIITDEDLAFHDKISPVFAGKKHPIPSPTLCPDCRVQRRMLFRNERHLTRRACDLCHKDFLTIYAARTPFPVYCHECWWSDKWDPLSFGRPYQPDVSFFDQFKQLADTVPHLGIVFSHCENCDYTNFINYSKNSYLMFGCHATDECLYGWRVHDSTKGVDCLQLDKSTLCYECVDCDDSYELLFSQDCNACRTSAFLYDCKGCSNCLCCANLKNKEYCIYNKQVTKEEFENEWRKLQSRQSIAALQSEWTEFLKIQPRRHAFILLSENATGDHLIQGQNLRACFHVKNAQDCAYLESCEDIKDSQDSTFSGWPAELVYECLSAGVQCYHNAFTAMCWTCNNILYCSDCHHSASLFGCLGLKQNRHCILNKQYSEEDYDQLCGEIITEMTANGEYGEFFPPSLSPFFYNQTIAQEFFPIKQEEAHTKGWQWHTEDAGSQGTGKVPPDAIGEVQDTITKETFGCRTCGHNFRIIPQELAFHHDLNVALPSDCFHCRHTLRMASRNPRTLWQRECMKCGKEMETTYAPDRPEKVYCEECYLQEVY